jgi:hypothetical protein
MKWTSPFAASIYPDTILPQDDIRIEDRLPWIQLADDLQQHARTRNK